jgi:hypothetical protein
VCPPFTYKIKLSSERRIFKTYDVYKYIESNIVTCMKVTGEIFSFQKKGKEAEEARY